MTVIKNKIINLTTLLLCLLCLPANATSSPAHKHLDDPQLVGEARFKVMFWDVFDASLYANSGRYNTTQPFALSLRYLRPLEGKKIVAKSMEEIRKQRPEASPEQLARWERELLGIIPDVSKGTAITGVRTNDGHTLFYFGDDAIGSINDTEFTNAFFDIWLGGKTSDPRFRYRLLGGGQDT
ncbi:MAG: chalcone isomerase family protein [Granulosicoccus sp.]